MTTIVIGTTPTIIYKFSVISTDDLIQAKMTIKGKNTILLSKFLSEATIGEDFNATIAHNGPNNTAHLTVYRATGNAVSNASVTVRKVWLKTGGA